MSTFLFHPPGITVKIIGMDCSTHGRSCYVHHICGHCLLWMWLFVSKDSRSLLMAKRGLSLWPTMSQIESIPVELASKYVNWQSSAASMKVCWLR